MAVMTFLPSPRLYRFLKNAAAPAVKFNARSAVESSGRNRVKPAGIAPQEQLP
jgi:hypothetical protein